MEVRLKTDNTHCCVPQCRSRGTTDPELHFHKFPSLLPRDYIRRRKWILALRIGKEVTPRMKVCSRHFKETDYMPRAPEMVKAPRLKLTAVPSQNLPVSNYEKNRCLEKKAEEEQVPEDLFYTYEVQIAPEIIRVRNYSGTEE